MSETLFIDQWINDTLKAVPAINNPTNGRMYPDVAPEKSEFPLVLWVLQTADDVFGQGSFRIMTRAVYQVKVIGQTRSYWDIRPIYKAIDDALNAKGGDTFNAHIFSCMRWEELRMVEFIEGVDYRHLGGMYQILVQPI